MCFKRFLGPQTTPKHVYTDGSKEFKFALTVPPCDEEPSLARTHDVSTPYLHETNGLVENMNRQIKEGTTAVLIQSGLNTEWWADAMPCFCWLRNTTEKMEDGLTAYERRFCEPYKGPQWPFGCEVSYKPEDPKHTKPISAFGPKERPGIL